MLGSCHQARKVILDEGCWETSATQAVFSEKLSERDMLQTVSESCGPRILVESKCPRTVGINAGAGTEVDDIVYTSVVGTAVIAV